MSSSQRPFRFGIQFAGANTKTEWADQARTAEALGYDILVMPDHLDEQFANGPALVAVAEATTTLRIGTLVLQNDLRHPALLAKEAATLDVLSDGRFELGLGAGGSLLLDYEWAGIRFDSPGTRVGRLHESVRILKALFAEGPLTFAGQYFTITELEGRPKPIQQPHPPILIAGGGPRMLSLAAREADIVSIFPTMLSAGGRFREDEVKAASVAKKVDLVRQAAGDRFPQVQLNILVQAVIVTNDRKSEMQRLSTARGLPVDHWLNSPHIYVGTVEQIVEDLLSYRERLGISYFVVFDRYMDAFAPVVARLTGR